MLTTIPSEEMVKYQEVETLSLQKNPPFSRKSNKNVTSGSAMNDEGLLYLSKESRAG